MSEQTGARPAPSSQINVTARQVSERLGIGLSTVYQLWDMGTIRSVRIGRKLRRTSWAWVQEYLDGSPGAVTQLLPRAD